MRNRSTARRSGRGGGSRTTGVAARAGSRLAIPQAEGDCTGRSVGRLRRAPRACSRRAALSLIRSALSVQDRGNGMCEQNRRKRYPSQKVEGILGENPSKTFRYGIRCRRQYQCPRRSAGFRRGRRGSRLLPSPRQRVPQLLPSPRQGVPRFPRSRRASWAARSCRCPRSCGAARSCRRPRSCGAARSCRRPRSRGAARSCRRPRSRGSCRAPRSCRASRPCRGVRTQHHGARSVRPHGRRHRGHGRVPDRLHRSQWRLHVGRPQYLFGTRRQEPSQQHQHGLGSSRAV